MGSPPPLPGTPSWLSGWGSRWSEGIPGQVTKTCRLCAGQLCPEQAEVQVGWKPLLRDTEPGWGIRGRGFHTLEKPVTLLGCSLFTMRTLPAPKLRVFVETKGCKLRLLGLSPLLNRAREAWDDEILFWAGEPMAGRACTRLHPVTGSKRPLPLRSFLWPLPGAGNQGRLRVRGFMLLEKQVLLFFFFKLSGYRF